MLERVMKFTIVHMLVIGIVALVLGGAGTAGFLYMNEFRGYMSEGLLVRVGGGFEGFSDVRTCNKCKMPETMCGCKKECNSCGKSKSNCGCDSSSLAAKCPPVAPCPRVMEPDLSKYILKSQVPSSSKSVMPEMTNYMLKTECPPVPDLSKYILKSSIPKPQPVIIDNSKCKAETGECPPCPRPRCPIVKCPPPTKCPTPAPCPRPVCPQTVVKCKSEEATQPTVRPFLAPLNMQGFGLA
jgi:hypothetical protein